MAYFARVLGILLTVSVFHHLEGTKLKATFSMSGIKGSMTFSQATAATPTSIVLSLSGINETLNWQIHSLPVIYKGNAATSCSSASVGALFDPENSASGLCSPSQKQSCAIGDLAGKLGSIGVQNMTSTYSDAKLPLTGRTSIFGRSIVLSTQGRVPKACALITSDDLPTTALATFKGPVAGTVYLRQTSENTATLVYVNLFFVNSSTSLTQFSWKIHSNLVGEDYTQPRCANLGRVHDPKSSRAAGASCSRTSYGDCAVGDLTGKLGPINVTAATSGLSSTQVAFTDVNLPITGAYSAVGRSLVLYDKSNVAIACADILTVQLKKAKATLTSAANDGVSGTFVFSQASLFDPTDVNIDIMNVRKLAQGYHVHEYPNPAYKKISGTAACAAGMAGQHLNPYGVVAANSPSAGAGTWDQYEIGDLSAKYGSFLNQDNHTGNYSDYNLPLFGRHSLVGRSVVIHKLKADGNKRWVCSNIDLDMPNTYRMETTSTFTKPDVTGHILMTQYRSSDANVAPLDTAIYLDLAMKDNTKTVDHNWHIHEKPVGDDMSSPVDGGRCSSLGPHYNPYNVDVDAKSNYKSTCSPTNALRCEVGDLSGKHQKYDMGSGPRFYTDVDSSLFGTNTVVGRGLIVHVKGGVLPRLGCADLVPDAKLYSEVTIEQLKMSTPFSKPDFIARVATGLRIPKWRVTYVRTMLSQDGGCETVKFGIIAKPGENTSTEKIKKDVDVLKQYRPCAGSTQIQLHTALVWLSLVVLSYFVTGRH